MAGEADLSAVEAVARMREGDLEAQDYARALLARCQAGRHLNAFIALSPETVLEAARAADRHRAAGCHLGPLHGLPIPIKDSVNTRDYPTTSGTPSLRGFRPRDDAPVVRALRDAGAIVLGKTNLSELSLGWTSANAAFGAVRNPHDPARIPGGSSGGTAVAVATGMAPLGVAEDTCGSIRVPAALSGIAGFRPTTFRYSPRGVMPLTPTFDTIGPHARTVDDLALFDTAVTGDLNPLRAVSPRSVRLAVSRAHYFALLDPEVARVIDEALAALRDAGMSVVEEDVPDVTRLVADANFPIIFHDSMAMIARYLEEFETGVTVEQLLGAATPAVRENLDARRLPGGRLFVSPEAYAAARDVHRPALQEAFRGYFCRTGAAAIAFPTTLVPATPIGQDQDVEIAGQKVPFRTAMSRNIAPGSCAGLPGLVLCAGVTRDGLPVGIEFDGPAGSDRELLALGRALERVLGPLPRPRDPAS
ncbi:MAG TPA: amidase family protein [Vicinamibacteria bacterium]|nr:amidase family protein [Vicinamibacteria bacterium]